MFYQLARRSPHRPLNLLLNIRAAVGEKVVQENPLKVRYRLSAHGYRPHTPPACIPIPRHNHFEGHDKRQRKHNVVPLFSVSC